MKTAFFIILAMAVIVLHHSQFSYKVDIQWAVIGAGPAGIAVIGVLTDFDVNHKDILWIDPEFKVGRLGKYYRNVPGNARAQSYVNFITGCTIFTQVDHTVTDSLLSMPCTSVPTLQAVIDPLQGITDYIRTKVVSIEGEGDGWKKKQGAWEIRIDNKLIRAHKVVVATGSHPKQTMFTGVETLDLDYSLDKNKLASLVNENDSVGVIGSAHSALLVVRFLSEIGVKSIYNFYKHTIVYPTKIHGHIAWSALGIKGELAKWSKEKLETGALPNLIRIHQYSNEVLQSLVPQLCSKVIVASGYERNWLPGRIDYDSYDPHTGQVTHNLYGVGIAFPEKKIDAFGNVEWSVGLAQFMDYLKMIVPLWIT
jgi:hypothetical protein